jgi:hypothetical protein
MHTNPSLDRPAEQAASATPAASPRESGSDIDRATRLLLWVWAGHAEHWRVRVELDGDETHDFHSPFELARFLTQLPGRGVSTANPVAGGGLR